METSDLVGLAAAFVGIAIAAWIARLRHVADRPHATRLGRLFFAALAFALVLHAQYTAWTYLSAGASGQLASNFWYSLIFFVILAWIILFPLELTLGYFVPTRTRAWLARAVAAFAVLGALFVAAPFWLAAERVTLEPGLLIAAVASAAAALVWWAFLPPPPDPA